MLDKQTVFGVVVGLVVLALGLFSSMQGFDGAGLMLVSFMILLATMMTWRFGQAETLMVPIRISEQSSRQSTR